MSKIRLTRGEMACKQSWLHLRVMQACKTFHDMFQDVEDVVPAELESRALVIMYLIDDMDMQWRESMRRHRDVAAVRTQRKTGRGR